jgi:3-dehydroquinate dehydratase
MFDAIELHRHGCRAVLVTTGALRPTVVALAGRLGMADLPVVEVDQPNRDQSIEEITATASGAMPAVVGQLVAAGAA